MVPVLTFEYLWYDRDSLPELVQSQGGGWDSPDEDLPLRLGQPEDGGDEGRLACPGPADYAHLDHMELVKVYK